MFQVVQNVKSGITSVDTIPAPLAGAGQVLVANCASLISAGTEKMVVDISRKSLIGKARERPDQLRRVIEKVKSEGLIETYRQVSTKLDQPIALGYCSAGTVIAVGKEVSTLRVGDRVACNGPHAGIVAVPKHLCAKFNESLPFEQAAFAVLGSIALQGVRLSRSALGESVFVIGLGLVGQLTVGLLHAAGCRVIGVDPDPRKCELALQSGAERAQPSVSSSETSTFSGGNGTDAVIITASTSSNAPIQLACDAVRQKGRIVLIGVVGMDMPRRPMYFKESEFIVSCSYGPGRYDSNYEDRGIDYPIGHVRWTEQRNIQAVIELMESGRLRVEHLISHRFDIEQAEQAYRMISDNTEPYLGIVLKYADELVPKKTVNIGCEFDQPRRESTRSSVGVLGVGNFATLTMIPAMLKTKHYDIKCVCSANGLNAKAAATKYKIPVATSDEDQLLSDQSVDAAFILTRHHLHASQVCKALNAGKHVFVEKPLSIDTAGLKQIESAILSNPTKVVMVGYNRRYSQAATLARREFESISSPLTIQYLFNAGAIPEDTWIHHPEEGGGRIIGEACHAIDLVSYLAGSRPVEVFASCISGDSAGRIREDQAFITIRHESGSLSCIGYLAGGSRSFPKERVEILGGGNMCVIDDFKEIKIIRKGMIKSIKTPRGKGYSEELSAFSMAMRTGIWPTEWNELQSTSLASFAAIASMSENRVICVQ